MPKLLAPAGSFQALKAAINAGADEVYLGGSAFNARINASNFDRELLVKAGGLCRNANVGLHITLNTLIYDKEFKAVLEYVDFLANDVRPDALIVQDLGLALALRRAFPSMALHASTQMRIHSHLDARFLKDLGFTRAVLARELPVQDIAAFVKTGLETEIFVHGAICVSESGGCLMSSVIGNRSGNRGECAQPCRLPCKGKSRYPLSLKDMCLASHIPTLFDVGVTSLKIEGRMKSPDYVGAVTSVYRRLIDEKRAANSSELKLLNDAFSRSGFTDGYFVSHITPNMFGVRSDADKLASSRLNFNLKKAETRPKYTAAPVPSQVILPEREEDRTIPPSKQKGIVLRFEGRLPSEAFLKKHADKACRIDVPLDVCTDRRLLPYVDKISAVLPRTVFESEQKTVKAQLKSAFDAGVRQATVSAIYQIGLCDGFYTHGDYAFNVVNRETLAFLERFSLSSVMLSPETDGQFARGSKCALEYIGYGRTPLMFTRTCIIRNISGCKQGKKCFSTLVDRTGAQFPIISGQSHTNTIYNSLPAYRLDRKAQLKKSGVGLLTLLFTDEAEQRMEEVISLYTNGQKPSFAYTRK